MFGYVIANYDKLTEDEELRYRSCYCGLCMALGKRHGILSRITLNYDLAFLALLLSALYEKDDSLKTGRCPIHPVKPRKYVGNEFIDYAADMNIVLSYKKFLDDWKDDKSITARCEAMLFEGSYRRIAAEYPVQCKTVNECMDELSAIEKAGILNPDIPAGCFGRLVGGIFNPKLDEYGEGLRAFGNSLGRFIYIMDACLDLKEDIRKERYNPMITISSADFDDILKLLMADCTEKYNSLNIKNDVNLIENILYSGVWTRYEAKNLKVKGKYKK